MRGTSTQRHAPSMGAGFRGWLADWAEAWNGFWFTPADPLPLAVVRIATGLILTWACLVWLLDADAFFGPRGWLAPGEVWRLNDQPWQWSWFFAADDPTAVRVLGGIALVAAILLTLGLATPLAAVASLIGLVCAANRAPLNTFGLDDTLGLLLIGLVSLWTPFLSGLYTQRWFAWPQIMLVGPVPLAVLGAGYLLLRGLTERRELSPFLSALALFVLSFIGLGISFFPYLVPHAVTIWQAAAPDNSLSFLLVGGVVLIPSILAYTAYAYWVFRGKVNAVGGYH